MCVVRIDPRKDGDDRIRELSKRGEHRGRPPEADVVERECEEPRDDPEVADPEAVVPACPRLRAHDGQCNGRADQPEEEAERDDVLELELAAHVAPEHRAERPEKGGKRRLAHRHEAFGGRVKGMRLVDQPEPEQGRHQEPGEPRPSTLTEDDRCGDDGDQRLDLLENDGGHEVAVEERLGEEDRRKRGGARADDHRAHDVAPACADHRPEGRGKQRERQQHEHDVLAEDDRRRRRRRAQRLADDRVRAPHGSRDCDEHDTGNCVDPRHRSRVSVSYRSRSSTPSRNRMTRASPSLTRITAGRGTPLYVEPIARVYAPVAGTARRSPRCGCGSSAASISTSPDSQCLPAIRKTPSASSSARFASSASYRDPYSCGRGLAAMPPSIATYRTPPLSLITPTR